MFVIIGWLVALGCIFGVFIVHGGNISVVMKALPFEMITIMGAAIGAMIANNQPKVMKAAKVPRRLMVRLMPNDNASSFPLNHRAMMVLWATMSDSEPSPNMKRPTSIQTNSGVQP